MAQSRTILHWIGPLLVLIGLLLFLYFASYRFLARNWIDFPKPSGGTVEFWSYNQPWQAKFFRPAAKIESILFGRNVRTAWEERLSDRDILHDE